MRKLPLFQPSRAISLLPPTKLMDSGYLQCSASIYLCLSESRTGLVPSLLPKSQGRKEDPRFIHNMSHLWYGNAFACWFFLLPELPIAPRESILSSRYVNQSSLASQSVSPSSPIIINWWVGLGQCPLLEFSPCPACNCKPLLDGKLCRWVAGRHLRCHP